MQHLRYVPKTILENTLEHFQDTVNLNNGLSLDQEFEDTTDEFDKIKARSVSVLTSGIVTLLTQENLLNEQICNHSTEADLNAVKKTCAGYLEPYCA